MDAFDNLNKLFKYVEKQMRDVQSNEMAEMVKDEEQKSIDKNVYDAYKPSSKDGEPWVYKRRRDNGGLRSKENMKVNVKKTTEGVELSVENTTKGDQNNYQLDEVVEYGGSDKYEYTSNRDGTANQYLAPRPFTEKTEESILNKNLHVETMKKGLRSRGIIVE